MALTPPRRIVIEHCVNCEHHTASNRHCEAKYRKYASALVQALERAYPATADVGAAPGVRCDVNPPPPAGFKMTNDKKSMYFCKGTKTSLRYPRFGAFEVYSLDAGGVLFFSKLKSRKWPARRSSANT